MVKQQECLVTIDKTRLPLNTFYLFFYSAVGVLLPFLPLYMKQLGLTAQESGIIIGSMLCCGLLAEPIVSFLAEHFQKYKFFLIFCTLLSGVVYMCLLLVPAKNLPYKTAIKTNVHCNTQDSYIRDCVSTEKNASKTFYQPLQSSVTSCPVTFYDYILSAKTNNLTELNCEASCLFAVPGAYTSRVCFTTDVRPFGERSCFDIWVSSSKETYLHFTISNTTLSLKSEIHLESVLLPHLICKDYNLKNLIHHGKPYWQMLCDEETVLNCQFQCTRQSTIGCEEHVNLYGPTFAIFLIIQIFCALLFLPPISLLDSIASYQVTEASTMLGHLRIRATFGHGLCALTSAGLMALIQEHPNKSVDYHVLFYLFFLLTLISSVIGSKIDIPDSLKSSSQNTQKLRITLRNCEILHFLFIIICLGIFDGSISSFLLWYLKDLNSSPLVFGICCFINSLCEIAVLLLSNRIIKLIGYVPSLALSLAAYCIRFFGYSSITESWLVLFFEPFHGLSFGLLFVSLSGYSTMLATTNGLRLARGLYFFFGRGVGALLTGVLFTILGSVWTWRVYSMAAFLMMLFIIPLQCFLSKQNQRMETPEQANKFESLDDGAAAESTIERLLTEECQSPETTIKGGKLAWSRDEL
ncbi:major facilitator superfamily domain-containing protein 6-like [Argonauta hians]